MSQAALNFGPSETERTAWHRVLDVVREVVATVGLKQLAFDLDCSPSLLGDALAERDRKGIRAEWIPTILTRATDLQRGALLCALAEPVGFDVVRRKVLTPEERLARLEALVTAKLGTVGEALLREVER